MWYKKNVLITGHTGFKGSWLCLLLNQLGSNISGLSLVEPVSSPDMYSVLEIDELVSDNRGDITQLGICMDIIKKTEPEIIFHMAAQPLVRESYADPTNTYGIDSWSCH